MNINRNNYEEYFLLYADNELSHVEKKVVEIFVQENVDLKEEFLMIQLTVSSPDEEAKLLDKSFLMKEEPPLIDENNCEEIFILYHDNELSNQQKKETEQFVNNHPTFGIQFELIGKTKLTPDENIVFPGKKQLYRKEKTGRVVPLFLWRFMAAAVFVGFGFWVVMSYVHKKEEIRTVALEGKTKKPIAAPESKAAEAPANTEDGAASSAEVTATKVKSEDTGVDKKRNIIKQENDQGKNTIARTIPKIKTIREDEVIPNKQENVNQLITVNIPVKDNSGKIKGAKDTVATGNVAWHVDKYDENIQPLTQVENVSYAVENNNNGNDENYIFYHIKTEEFNKSKVGGFLKKVKRVVERNNPITRLLSGDDKQVASK